VKVHALSVLVFAILSLGVVSQASAQDCQGCTKSFAGAFDASGEFVSSGPFGSQVSFKILSSSSGTCTNADEGGCDETECSFTVRATIEVGSNGVAWEQKSAVSDHGSSFAYSKTGVVRVVPTTGNDGITTWPDAVRTACGVSRLFFLTLWFDQPVPSWYLPPNAQSLNVWETAVGRVNCSDCIRPAQ
jgi:hypothetical protein